MSESKALAPHLVGGNFLLQDTESSNIFTPEDLSSDQRQMAETAQKFMDKDVLSQLDALSLKNSGDFLDHSGKRWPW